MHCILLRSILWGPEKYVLLTDMCSYSTLWIINLHTLGRMHLLNVHIWFYVFLRKVWSGQADNMLLDSDIIGLLSYTNKWDIKIV